jgi:hypothetical protein
VNTETNTNPELPEDPVRRARYVAIRAAGGTVRVARAIGKKSHETVRRWYVDTDPSAPDARTLVSLCGGVVKLPDVLPAAYAGLSLDELGYLPNGDQESAA